MDITETWKDLAKWLRQQRNISLPRGKDFCASYKSKIDSIEVIPSLTGIPRLISKNEWTRFCEKYNTVIKTKYNPLRPGHYAQISHNSSYIVAILKESGCYK